MKVIASIKASELKRQYKLLGTDISRIIEDIEEFKLIEDDDGLRQWSPSKPGDGQFYSELAENNTWYYPSAKKEFDIAYEFIGNKSVVEIGCGEGCFPMTKKISSYIGLELNETAVASAKAKGLNVKLQDFKEYASENPSSIANVCSFQVLEHLPNPEDYFKSSHELLQDEGLLITAVPTENSFVGTFYFNCLNAPPHHINRWTNKCLRELPRKYGFECVEIINIPVEPQDYERFWRTLLIRALNPDDKNLSMVKKIRAKVMLKIIKFLGFTNYVPEDFCIPGQTVVSVHKKIAI